MLVCFARYVWRTTEWGECRILPFLSQQDRRQVNVSVLCGGGVQTRKTYCVQVPDDSAPLHRKEGKKIYINKYITIITGLVGSLSKINLIKLNIDLQFEYSKWFLPADYYSGYRGEKRNLWRCWREKKMFKVQIHNIFSLITGGFSEIQFSTTQALNNKRPLLQMLNGLFYL